MNDSTTTRELPKGWRWQRLGDVCDIVARQVDPKIPEFGRLPHINGENIESGTGRVSGVRSASDDGMESGKYLFEEGDVLYSKLRPYLRKVALAEFRGLCSADMYPIRPDPMSLDATFVLWLLLSEGFTNYADEESRRARMPKLNREQLFAWEAPIPPLAEQRRIAGVLREQMAAVARARAALDAQLAAAEALPAAHLRAVFQTLQAKRWPRLRLGDFADITGGIQKTPDRAPVKLHKAFLTVRNVQHGFLDLSVVERFEVTPKEFERYRLQAGDLLLVEGNGSKDHIGRNAVFQEEGEWIHQNHIIRVRLPAGSFSPEFISRFLSSNEGRALLLEKAQTTTGLHTLSTGKVGSLEVPAPPLPEQRAVAAQLANELTAVARVRSALAERRAALAQLPAALLRRAFAGEV